MKVAAKIEGPDLSYYTIKFECASIVGETKTCSAPSQQGGLQNYEIDAKHMSAGKTYTIKVSVIDDDNTLITSCKQNLVILDKDRVAVKILMTSP